MRPWTTVAVLLALSPSATAADWPQWLGPTRDGAIPGKLGTWTGDLKGVWRQPVGEGNSSPVVAGGLVFLHSKVKDKDAEIIQARDAKTGELKWEKSYDRPAFKPFFGEGPRGTPTVHDGFVYTFGNTGILVCWEAATGNKVWQAETLADPKKDNLKFGLSASPLVVGDVVVVQRGGGGSKGLRAYDRKTGKEAWSAGADAASYAAPVVLGGDIVALTGAHLTALTPAGQLKWKFPFVDILNESSTTPIKAGDLYVAASVTAGAVGVRVTEKDGKPTPEAAWKNANLTCYFSTPVPVGKAHLFVVTGSISNPSVVLRCVETATGKEVWNKPNIGKYHAALLRDEAGTILMHSDDGSLRLLAPNVTKYEELAKSKGCGPTWAHPAVADGKLYVRDDKEVICLELPK
jgi:outer membrane protein assembly factor BamB